MHWPNSILLSDFFSNKNVWYYYNKYKETQWYDEGKTNSYQLSKLRNLLAHCKKNVPFYRNILYDHKININDVRDLEVLSIFPIIDKQTVIENYSQFIPDNISKISNVKYSKTSGTTGQVLKVLKCRSVRSSTWGSFSRFYDWIGRGPADIIVNFKGSLEKKSDLRKRLKILAIQVIENERKFNSYDLCEKQALSYFNFLSELNKPIILKGYPLHLASFARIFQEFNLNLKIKAITTTAEPLKPNHRILFKEIFGCETYDQYGCGEIGGVAYECNFHQGLHITQERVIVERTGFNEIVLTDLDNYAFPLIRYKNGDIVNFSSKPCPCGRLGPLIETVEGRTSDMVYGPNGAHLHWGFFHHLFIVSGIAEQNNLLSFQIIQSSLENISIDCVSTPLNSNQIDLIKKVIKEKLDISNVEIKNVQKLVSLPSGKHKAVQSMIDRRAE